jgi:hypothetical protein
VEIQLKHHVIPVFIPLAKQSHRLSPTSVGQGIDIFPTGELRKSYRKYYKPFGEGGSE